MILLLQNINEAPLLIVSGVAFVSKLSASIPIGGYFGLFVLFAILGFFRSTITGVRPEFILDQKKIQDDWASRSSFTTIIMPIMAFFIFLFNAVAWAVYGLISIVEFLAFIFKAIWWLIDWVWNEVIHSVVFFIVKLVWHYIVIWSWRFFKIAFTKIPEAFKVSSYKNGFISVLAISFVAFLFFYLSSIFQQEWIMIIMIFPFLLSIVYFSGYTLYNDSERSFSEYWTGTMTSYNTFMILISIVSAALIVVLHIFANTILHLPVLGFSFPVTQILIMILVVAVISSLVANIVLPAYISASSGDFDTKDFLINTGIRLPRFLGAVPFVLLGGFFASIITLIIGGFLWWSVNTVKDTFCENAYENVYVELNTFRSEFRTFADTTTQPTRAVNYSAKSIKRIAILESRIFTLDLIERDWFTVMLDLSSGIRSTKPDKDYLKRIDETYKVEQQRLIKDIDDVQNVLSQLLIKIKVDASLPNLAESIERREAQLKALKRNLGNTETRKILNTRLTEARIKSIKYVNIMWVIGTFFAIFGFVLLAAIVFTPFWVYRTKVYFDLYDYHHEGKSYLTQQIEFYKERNENQPLLGFFVVAGIIVALIAIRFIL